MRVLSRKRNCVEIGIQSLRRLSTSQLVLNTKSRASYGLCGQPFALPLSITCIGERSASWSKEVRLDEAFDGHEPRSATATDVVPAAAAAKACCPAARIVGFSAAGLFVQISDLLVVCAPCFQGPAFSSHLLLFPIPHLICFTHHRQTRSNGGRRRVMKPYWILRHHGSSSIRSLHHHRDHRLLGIGDDKGSVSLVDLKLLRARWRWDAHTDSILTVHIVSQHQILTHARDNTLKLWTLPDTPPSFGAATQTSSDATSTTPTLIRTIGVNALNFSKCAYFDGKVAVPNALDAAYIDILDLNSGMRTHEAIADPTSNQLQEADCPS